MLIMSRTCCDCFLCKEHQIYSFPEYESPTRKSWDDNDPDYCIEHNIVSNSTKFREHTHVYNFQEREWNTLSNRRQDAGCVCVCVCVREREREREKDLNTTFASKVNIIFSSSLSLTIKY